MGVKQRSINTDFWNDEYILDLERYEEKLLFLYLITGPLTNIAGAYKIARRLMRQAIDVPDEVLTQILTKFEADGKLLYRDGWMVLTNFLRHQRLNENMRKGVLSEISTAPGWVIAKVLNTIQQSRKLRNDFESLRMVISEIETLSAPEQTLSHRFERLRKIEDEDEVESKDEREEESASPPDTKPDRKDHPAIISVREVVGVYPPKEIWDEIIDRLGFEIDVGKLKKCFTTWRTRGYNKMNYAGWIDWYHEGIPKQGNSNGTNRTDSTNGNKPTSASRLADTANIVSQYPTEAELRDIGRTG